MERRPPDAPDERERRLSPRTPRRTATRATPASQALASLESIAREFGPGIGRRKRALLVRLEHASLPDAAAVERLHEVASFLLAYPDDARVHRAASRLLTEFAARRDLQRLAPELVNSGIAGTAIEYRFFSKMARWLASRWPERMAIDWEQLDDTALLEALLPLLAHPAEAPALDEYDLGLRGWLDRMKGPGESDAAFLVRAIASLPAAWPLRAVLQDALDVPMSLAWGPSGPTRTAVRVHTPKTGLRGSADLSPQQRPLSRERPDLVIEAHHRPVRVITLTPAEGELCVDVARAAMVTRQRDLDAFANADPRDARLIEYEDGVSFICLGVVPADRLLLESVYGFITLKNGTPIGYVLTSALYQSCEIAYNVFDTFRGAEAAVVYARVIAMSRHLFGANVFTIYPYQLGDGNDEAVESGAWWFYYKLGFRPKHRGIKRLVARELARMQRHPTHRSSPSTLRRLAADNLYLCLGADRHDVIGQLPLASVGLAVSDLLAARYGSARADATAALTREAQRLLGVQTTRRWRPAEREAFDRWAPLVLALPEIRRWNPADRQALAGVIRAKGGVRESDFVHRFDAHRRLRQALAALSHRATP